MNKILSIPLILIFSVSLFMTSAFADGCEGGDSCFKCVQMDHRHPAIPETGFMPIGCQPGAPKSACGIAASQAFGDQAFLISAVRVDNQQDSDAAAGWATEAGVRLFPTKTISPGQQSVVTIATPIYLSNLSLLC